MDRYANACRICLKEDGIKIPIFEEEGVYRKITQKMRDCLKIIVYKSDPLPKHICNRCYYKLDLASQIKQEYHRSNAIFVKHLASIYRESRSARDYLRLIQKPQKCPKACVTATSKQRPQALKHKPPAVSSSIRRPVSSMPALRGPVIKRPYPVVNPSSKITRSSGLPILEKTGSTQISSSAVSCEVCDREFASRKLLSMHLLSHTKEEFIASPKQYEYACNICGRTFEQPKSLKMHSIKYHKVRLVDVSPHKKIPENPFLSQNIKKEPEESTPYECNICFQKLEDADSLTAHMDCEHNTLTSLNAFYKNQPKDARPECVFCFQTFKTNSGLVNHLRTTHGKPCCTICLEIFDSHKDLVDHRAMFHKQVPTPTPTPPPPPESVSGSEGEFACDLCGKSFGRQVSLMKHKIYHMRKGPGWTPIGTPSMEKTPTEEPENLEVYKCNYCGKEFDKRISYIRHKAVHTKKGPSWVPLEMQGKTNVTQNVETPPDDVNVNDTSLNPVEDTMKKLKINKAKLKSNNSGLPYCLHCKKLYGSNYKLWEHVRKVHPGSERYKCPHRECRRVFFTKRGYKSHLTTHKSVNPPSEIDGEESTQNSLNFPCHVCTLPFNNKAKLNRHILLKHSPDSPVGGNNKIKNISAIVKQNGTQLELPNRLKFVHPRVLCRFCPKYLSKRYMAEHIKIHQQAGHKPLTRNSGTVTTHEDQSSPTLVTIKKEKVDSFDFDKPGPLSRKLLWQNQQKRRPTKKKPLCKYCNTYLTSFEELKKHLTESHHDCIFFACTKCPEIYYNELSLKTHRYMHSRSYTKCKYCGRSFAYMAAHEKSCPGLNSGEVKTPKPISLPPLSSTAQTVSPKKGDKEDDPKIFSCDFCGSQFLETHSFVKHLQSHAR